ncbi:MAG TPA: c-type cytochrome, partial [Burkholderiales bacterium]|nr:c-type cytochrome [Burkholderiales bacterium]
IAMVAALAICEYTPPTSVADPTDTSFLPRPEWNFLFLYQLQRYLPGSIEAVGTTLIPGLLVLLLIALPFLDRGQLRTPSGRLGFLLGGTLIAALVVGLTVLAVMSDAATWEYVTHPVVREGAHLYAENDCGSCHRIRGEGASSAPDLSFIGQLREREWLRTYVRDPDSLNPATAMPPYTRLSATELDAIASYLKSLR